jgi:zinc-ribbon family
MIIYGTRAKRLTHENLMDKCPNCGSLGTSEMHVFQKYAHVFWIPFFPIRKIGVSQCNHCKQVLKDNEMPGELKETYNRVKAGTKTPIWSFIGAALLAVLIISIVISERDKDARIAKLVLQPAPGDVYEIKTKSNQYSLIRIEQVNGDTVLFRQNEYETNKLSGLDDIRKKGMDAYSEDVYLMTRKGLKELYDKGSIEDIERK